MIPSVASKTAAGVRRALTQLRNYQLEAKYNVYESWDAGDLNVLLVLPTGGGKTVILSHVVLEHEGSSVVLAHRRELIGQICLALARNGVYHRIVAPDKVIKSIIRMQVEELGVSYYDASARTGVASVDTLTSRIKKASSADVRWFNAITLWVQDEAHHVLRKNKWGKALEAFPNAKGLGVTATPSRADGKGLGAHADGVFHSLVEGPTMRWLINEGFLTDYRVVCPPNDLDMSDANIGSEGDYTFESTRKAVRKSHIIGDAVATYQQFCSGKRGVTFVPDVETAGDMANKFRLAGVPSDALSAKSTDMARTQGVKRLASGDLLQLVNVDLFGEGFDLPAIDLVQFARPTLSLALYMQQAGRALRPIYAPGYDLNTREGRLAAIAAGPKPCAWLIDHVGVFLQMGPPDRPRKWTLDSRQKRGSGPNDSVPVRVCLNPVCMAAYERFEPVCPYCNTAPEPPARRDGPEFVDGDLTELDAETLARMRGEQIDLERTVEQIRADVIDSFAPAAAHNKLIAIAQDDQIAQRNLIKTMEWWSGWQRDNGLDTLNKRYKKFFYTFGIDALSAKALKRADAQALQEKIKQHMGVE